MLLATRLTPRTMGPPPPYPASVARRSCGDARRDKHAVPGQDRETPHVHEGELHRDPVESHLRLSPTEVHPELEHPLATAGVQVPAPMPAAPGVPPAPAPMRLMPAPTDLHPGNRPASTLLADRERQHDRVRLPLPHVLQCQDCWAHQRHSQRERRAGLGAGPGVGTALQPCRGRHSLTAVQGQAQPCRRSRQSRNIIFIFHVACLLCLCCWF